MKIAVLIPVYNAERYLPQCLDSVLAQTYPWIEIFCRDDGSTDGSLMILNGYAAKCPQIHVASQANAGVSVTRNRLMDGLPDEIEAFAFVDADDYVAPEMYAALVEGLEKTGADVAETNGPEGGCVIDDLSLFLLRATAPGMWINVINKLYRRKSVAGLRFREGLCFEEDFFFNYEVNAVISRKVLVPGSFYTYRSNPDSATSTLNLEKYFDSATRRIRLSSVEFLEAGRIPETMVSAFRAELAKDAYRMCLRKNLKKNKNAHERRKLFFRAADFFEEMEREHGFVATGLNPVQHLLYLCCRHRLYRAAFAVAALT